MLLGALLAVHTVASASSTRLLFGSCNKPALPSPLWRHAAARASRTGSTGWLFAGDNVYADRKHACIAGLPSWQRMQLCLRELAGGGWRLWWPATELALRREYEALLEGPGFGQTLRPAVAAAGGRVMATWDDHDYGLNNGDGRFEGKQTSQRLFLDAFGVPAESERRDRAGVYHEERLSGPDGRVVSVLLLDVRYHKTGSDMLGDKQWRWLAERLAKSRADLTLVVSGVQVLHQARLKQEAWRSAPAARDRLLQLLMSSKARAPVLISGDVHFAELSEAACRSDQGHRVVLPELTSSGLTHAWLGPGSPNWLLSWVLRTYLALMPADYDIPGARWLGRNFGELVVDWAAGTVRCEIVGDDGAVKIAAEWSFDQLKPRGSNKLNWRCSPSLPPAWWRTQLVNAAAVLLGLSTALAVPIGVVLGVLRMGRCGIGLLGRLRSRGLDLYRKPKDH